MFELVSNLLIIHNILTPRFCQHQESDQCRRKTTETPAKIINFFSKLLKLYQYNLFTFLKEQGLDT
jgi:hypothetical protein